MTTNKLIGISYMDYYLPNTKLEMSTFLKSISADKVPKTFQNIEEYSMFVEVILGLENIRIEEHKNDFQMLETLIDKMFLTQPITAEQIDVIMVVQNNRPNQTINLGQCIQYKKNLKNAFVINLTGNQCTNVEVAISVARSMISGNNTFNNILILASNRIEDNEQRIIDSYGIYGDGAGLVMVSRDSLVEHVDSNILCNGSLYDYKSNPEVNSVHSEYYMNCIKTILTRNSLDPTDIDKVIIQNANPLLITQCLSSIGIESERIFDKNLSSYGHLDCLDFIINLKDFIDFVKLDNKSTVLAFGVGFSGTYISSLYRLHN